jgi:hypothetical protein
MCQTYDNMVDIRCQIWYVIDMREEKLLQKALNSPQNMRFSEFETLLKHFDFYLMNSGGGHFIYRNDEMLVSLPVQEKGGRAKTYQVEQFLEILRRNNAI